MFERWGKEGKYAFREALERGEVPPEELRAVRLLAAISDPARIEFYLMTGVFPARGNLTGLTYLVKKGGGVYEISGVDIVASWCIAVEDGLAGRHAVPPTDHVTALRTLIEGEEQAFRREGNRSTYISELPRLVFGRNVYGEPFCEADPRLEQLGLNTIVDFDSQLVDLEALTHGDLDDDPILNEPVILQEERPVQTIGYVGTDNAVYANAGTVTNFFYPGTNVGVIENQAQGYAYGQARFALAT